jgi:hypothetical protein
MKIFLEKTYGVKQQTEEIQDSRCLFLLLWKVIFFYFRRYSLIENNDPNLFQDTNCIGFSKLVFNTPPDAPIDITLLLTDENTTIENVELSKCYLLKGMPYYVRLMTINSIIIICFIRPSWYWYRR